ncbi:MAG: DNA replication and repair protein RecF [Flavobacteriales bacterium]|nr:DNA replication and repair protein RecF [Flavobacteriales bacterium]
MNGFKNYPECVMEFSEGVNCLVGDNGSGKTNVLDAIHYLGITKSYFSTGDLPNIRHGEDYFILRGEFTSGTESEEISCSVKKGVKKTMTRNKVEYEKLSEHFGLFPVVVVAPDDTELVLGPGELRRKLIDSIISTYSKPYLNDLLHYNHALLQRNNLLKTWGREGALTADLLEPWDMQLIGPAERIHEARKKFIQRFIPVFQHWYSVVCGGLELPAITYKSDLQEGGMQELLHANLHRDRMAERTTAGPHRDELEFELDGYPLRKFASQGQKKTFLIALKLAQHGFLAGATGKIPLLLLDDVFDKMDEKRTASLLEVLKGETIGQVFITDTHHDRIPGMLAETGIAARTFLVRSGVVNPETQIV